MLMTLFLVMQSDAVADDDYHRQVLMLEMMTVAITRLVAVWRPLVWTVEGVKHFA